MDNKEELLNVNDVADIENEGVNAKKVKIEPPPGSEGSFTFQGYTYQRKDTQMRKGGIITCYYVCAHHKAKKCTKNCSVKFHPDGNMEYVYNDGEHLCTNAAVIQSGRFAVIDLQQSMRAEVSSLAVQQPQARPKDLAVKVLQDTQADHSEEMVKLLDVNQLCKEVYNARAEVFGTSWEGAIKSAPLINPSDTDDRLFLQFDAEWAACDKTFQRILGWAHPDLVFLLKTGPLNAFVDCTFKCVPAPFKQLMVFMVYSRAHRTYVPVFYVLVQSKLLEVYERALREIWLATGKMLKCISFTCDFEQNLITAGKEVFKDTTIIPCYFHWKQALRRKLVDLGIPADVITAIAGDGGHIELLTVLPVNQILQLGIPYIRQQTAALEAANPRLTQFWDYFVATWLKKYKPEDWNLNKVVAQSAPTAVQDFVCINRTNNALERHNRALNERFPNAHPNVMTFVNTIRLMATEMKNSLDRIQRGMEQPIDHDDLTLPKIPIGYYIYANGALEEAKRLQLEALEKKRLQEEEAKKPKGKGGKKSKLN
jgi:hypothetical protein